MATVAPDTPLITCLHAPNLGRLPGEAELGQFYPWTEQLPEPTHLYFGVEFCPHLLPHPDDVEAAARWAYARSWGFTFLTPYVLDAQLDLALQGAARILEADLVDRLEVVVNDWGLLRALRRRFGGRIQPILGRTLNRAQRDPRIPDIGPEHLGGDPVPDTWRRASHDSSSMRAFLREVGVERVETDIPQQGLLEPEGGDDALPLAVHLPYGMVASGRICMVSSLGKPASHRFTAPRSCDAPCRNRTLELRAPWTRRNVGPGQLPIVDPDHALPLTHLLNRRRNRLPEPEQDPAPRFFQKGNTHFYRLEGVSLEGALRWSDATPSVDRLVLAPQVPM